MTKHIIAGASLAAFVLSSLVGCAPVQHSNSISQQSNTELVAGVGDTVLDVTKEKNLPNAFGASDIFGRKTPTGRVTVEYLGVRKGKAIFKRHTVDIETGATTMNSSPVVIPNNQTTTHSGIVGGTMYSGTSTTYAPPTVIAPNTPQAQVLGSRTTELAVDLKKADRALIVEGKTLNIISADNSKVVYSISE